MAILPAPHLDIDDHGFEPEVEERVLDLVPMDDVLDLSDRRRVLLRLVFGIDAPPASVDGVFTPSGDREKTPAAAEV